MLCWETFSPGNHVDVTRPPITTLLKIKHNLVVWAKSHQVVLGGTTWWLCHQEEKEKKKYFLL